MYILNQRFHVISILGVFFCSQKKTERNLLAHTITRSISLLTSLVCIKLKNEDETMENFYFKTNCVLLPAIFHDSLCLKMALSSQWLLVLRSFLIMNLYLVTISLKNIPQQFFILLTQVLVPIPHNSLLVYYPAPSRTRYSKQRCANLLLCG
jgi:hypothetical protein